MHPPVEEFINDVSYSMFPFFNQFILFQAACIIIHYSAKVSAAKNIIQQITHIASNKEKILQLGSIAKCM